MDIVDCSDKTEVALYFRYVHFSEACVFQGNLFCNQKKGGFEMYFILFQMYNISIYTLLYHHIILVSY